MTILFSLITVGHENIDTRDNVIKIIKHLPGIDDVKPVFGQYDIIVKTQDIKATIVRDLIAKTVRAIPGIRSTLTLICGDKIEI